MDRRLIVATSFLALAATSAPAWAGWGCGYRYSGLVAGAYGIIWSAPSEQQARESAMKLCNGSGNPGCFVVSCADNVDTRDQARARWPMGNAVPTNCLRNGRVVATDKNCD